MSEQIAAPAAPVEAPDPFQGGEPTFEEFSKYRVDGTIPERFAASVAVTEKVEEKKLETPAPKGETVEGKEPSESEQAKQERERDEKGKFAKKVEFSPEQQEAFDKAFRKREAKLRRELEEHYAAKTSAPQATAAAEKPDTAAEPQRPEPPKLSTYKGSVEEFEKELSEEYPKKLQAWLDAQSQHRSRVSEITKRVEDSEKKAIKAHPDYQEEFQSLANDIKNNEEPALPPHVLQAIAEEADSPHELTYYLAKNREEFRKFATLSPQNVLREVLKLDLKLAAPTPAPAKAEPPPKPKPPEPVGARATSSAFDVTDEKIDDATWAKLRNKQVAERRGR